MSTNYLVVIDPFAEKHYIKTFSKKYKQKWDITLSALKREFESFDVILEKSIGEEITNPSLDNIICKTEFKIAGTKESRHSSGNRCIVAKTKSQISILLVYHKSNLKGANETVSWKSIIKNNYPQYRDLL